MEIRAPEVKRLGTEVTEKNEGENVRELRMAGCNLPTGCSADQKAALGQWGTRRRACFPDRVSK